MDYKKLAKRLFPAVTKTEEDYQIMYPKRNLPSNAKVTRLGPSPTGFIHLGNLYGAFAGERLAHQSNGVFYLRIEDTDDKRFVEGAVDSIIDSLDFFGISFDEGATPAGDRGEYSPYFQSRRIDMYQSLAKKMVENGLAYPCFLTEEEIASIRRKQEINKETPGIYGRYAPGRNLTYEEIDCKIRERQSYVLRLRSRGNSENPEDIQVKDGIRGLLTMPENFQDVVLLKANGVPTYHFAHVCDDHFMRTTHVIRGEEWLSSLPIHIELFKSLDFPFPIYCHTAVLMKKDEEGNKRKLSKRKDPELALSFYREEGYHPQAVKEYLLTLLNSNYEEWRIANPHTPWKDFPFTLEKMSTSGALFDLDKLKDVSKDVLITIPAAELVRFLKDWAGKYRPEILPALERMGSRLLSILDLGRTGKKPRKDFITASQIFHFTSYFYDDFFQIEEEPPAETSPEDIEKILTEYLTTYDHSDDQSRWFDKIRIIAQDLGYAVKPRDYKKNPEGYKGHVGHVSTIIRLALTGRTQSPDIWEIQQILGEEKVRQRIADYMEP